MKKVIVSLYPEDLSYVKEIEINLNNKQIKSINNIIGYSDWQKIQIKGYKTRAGIIWSGNLYEIQTI